jgi:UDP-glucose 4-epimerase
MPSSPQFVLDIEKSRRELDYMPHYNFDRLIEDFKKEMEREPFAKIWGRKEDFVKNGRSYC